MAKTDGHNHTNDTAGPLDDSLKTVFWLWLLFCFSAVIVMAQDTIVGWNTPRLNTSNATAEFTKILVIHGLWLLASVAFVSFAFWSRPARFWYVYAAFGIAVVAWTVGVIVWASGDAKTMRVSVWRCAAAPVENQVTIEFLDTCESANAYSDLRLDRNIYLWSFDDVHHWRWIVPGEGDATLQTVWPSHIDAVYLAPDRIGAEFLPVQPDATIGGTWGASFNPQEDTNLRLFYINATGTSVPEATPDEFISDADP